LLLILATACTGNDAAASHFVVVKLPASIALLVLAGFGCGLAGFGFGLVVALQLLRAADSAAAQYHRAQIARVLGASSSVHASVQEALSIVHRRTQELQRLVGMLQRGGAK
jgi:alpha/beta superfamily hydrolase